MNINIINLLFIFTLKIRNTTMMQFYCDPSNNIDNNKKKEEYGLIYDNNHMKIYRTPSSRISLIMIHDLHNTIDFFHENSIIFTITKNSFTSEVFSYNCDCNTTIISTFNIILDILTLQFDTKHKIIEKSGKIIYFLFKEQKPDKLKKENMDLYTETLFNMCNELHEELLLLGYFSTSKFTNKYFQSVIDNFKVLIEYCIRRFIQLSSIYLIINILINYIFIYLIIIFISLIIIFISSPRLILKKKLIHL